ncbi:MAG: hypothetical protein R3F05_21035 [Planctomycetota bacterium]
MTTIDRPSLYRDASEATTASARFMRQVVRSAGLPQMHPVASEDLRLSTLYLESLLLTAVFCEAAAEVGYGSLVDALHHRAELTPTIASRAYLDYDLLATAWPADGMNIESASMDDVDLDLLGDALQRLMAPVLGMCPIDTLTEAALQGNEPGRAHRLRCAYEGLLAYVRRHQSSPTKSEAVAYHAYTEGRISVEELAGVLGRTPSDVVADLERFSFCRPLDAIELGEDQRQRLLSKLRAARSTYGHTPSGARARRSAIASMRIEDVDARPFLGAR